MCYLFCFIVLCFSCGRQAELASFTCMHIHVMELGTFYMHVQCNNTSELVAWYMRYCEQAQSPVSPCCSLGCLSVWIRVCLLG